MGWLVLILNVCFIDVLLIDSTNSSRPGLARLRPARWSSLERAGRGCGEGWFGCGSSVRGCGTCYRW